MTRWWWTQGQEDDVRKNWRKTVTNEPDRREDQQREGETAGKEGTAFFELRMRKDALSDQNMQLHDQFFQPMQGKDFSDELFVG